MKKILFTFIALCLLTGAAEGKIVKIPAVNVTEVAGATPGLPRGQIDRLIDGKKMQFVFWPTWNKKRQPHIDLFFDLQTRSVISALELNLFRRGKNLNEYNPKLLELYVDNGSGTFIPAATWNDPPTIPGNRGSIRLKVDNVKGQRFKLRVSGVKYIALTEVTFYGEMPAGYTAPLKLKNYNAPSEKMRKIFHCAKLFLMCAAVKNT